MPTMIGSSQAPDLKAAARSVVSAGRSLETAERSLRDQLKAGVLWRVGAESHLGDLQDAVASLSDAFVHYAALDRDNDGVTIERFETDHILSALDVRVAVDSATDVVLSSIDVSFADVAGSSSREAYAIVARGIGLARSLVERARRGAAWLERVVDPSSLAKLRVPSVEDYWLSDFSSTVVERFIDASIVEFTPGEVEWWTSSTRSAIALDALMARVLLFALDNGRVGGLRQSTLEIGSLRRRLVIWWRNRGRLDAEAIASEVAAAVRAQQLGLPLAEQAGKEAQAAAALLTAMQQLAATGKPGEAYVRTNTMTAGLVVDESGRWSARAVTHSLDQVRTPTQGADSIMSTLRTGPFAELPDQDLTDPIASALDELADPGPGATPK
jgi:hypothetical protein